MIDTEFIKVLKVDRFEGQVLDTTIELRGNFTIEGEKYDHFRDDLKKLINKYRI